MLKCVLGAAAVSACLFWAMLPAHASVTFDFSNESIGTTTPFSDTVDGLTADFSSDGDPGQYSVESDTTFNTLGTQDLEEVDYGYPLFIQFSQPIYGISVDFATITERALPTVTPDITYPQVDLNGRLGGPTGSFAGGTITFGSKPPGTTFPEGVATFTNTGGFDFVDVSTDANVALNVGNIVVDDGAVDTPEPGTWTALAIGGILLGGLMLKRRKVALTGAHV